MNSEQIRVWLQEIVKGLVKNPSAVEVTMQEPDEKGVLYTLRVDPYDAGRIIGKDGKNSDKIRAILNLCGLHNGCRSSLKIEIPEKN